MNRNAEVLDLILQKAGRKKISHTRLLKLAYMVDLLAWRVLGAPISEFGYRRYKQGPFDAEFYSAIEALLEASRAETEEKTTTAGNDCTLIRATPADPPGAHAGEFTPGQLHLVDVVIRRYGSMKLQKFIEQVVYQTEPMKNTEFGARLHMEAEKDLDREAVGGLSLETILESREAFLRGEGLTSEEFVESLTASER